MAVREPESARPPQSLRVPLRMPSTFFESHEQTEQTEHRRRSLSRHGIIQVSESDPDTESDDSSSDASNDPLENAPSDESIDYREDLEDTSPDIRGGPPYKCRRLVHDTGMTCGAILANIRSFRNHDRESHNSGKPRVACEHCDTTFTGPSSFRRHMRNRHPNIDMPAVSVGRHRMGQTVTGSLESDGKKLFTCEYCAEEASFTRADSLRRHLRNFHPEITVVVLKVCRP